MGNLSARNFGLIIAYVIPGFIAIWGVSLCSDPIRLWLLGADNQGPSVGGVLYLLLACIASGMTASAIRWAVLDLLHHVTGLLRPSWNDARLPERLDAYQLLVDIHYRYYQFYANSLVSLLFTLTLWKIRTSWAWTWADPAVLFVAGVFFAGSRDALRKYYQRTVLLLGNTERGYTHDQRRTSRKHRRAREQAGQAGQASSHSEDCHAPGTDGSEQQPTQAVTLPTVQS